MNHKFVETQQSVDKYTLNELTPEEREEFEKHLFDCPICADLVRQNFTVVENLKEVLLEERVATPAAATDTLVTGWRAWLRMPSLVPTCAALALGSVVVYQDLYPKSVEMVEVLPQVAAVKATTRGLAGTVRVDRKSPVFVLPVNIDTLPAGSFACEFYDAGDRKVLTQKSGPMNSEMDLRILLPTKSFPAGRYHLILRTDSKPGSINSYQFQIQDAN